MKLGSVLAISLLANAALVVAWFFLPVAPAPVATEPEISTGSPARIFQRRAGSPRAITIAVTNQLGHGFRWKSVESSDYKFYISNLRGIGCPEETVRDIIIADVNKLYAPRFAALQKPEQEKKFWEVERQEISTPETRERAKQLTALNKEKEALLKELLGIRSSFELSMAMTGLDYMELQYDYLSETGRKALRGVMEKFQEEVTAFNARTGGNMEDYQAENRKMLKRKDAELAKVLSPEEYLQYQLRSSDVASNLRYNELDGLKVSEKEFGDIFKFKQLEQDRPEGNTKETREAYAKSVEDAKKTLKEALGPDRYAEYERNQNYEYRQAAKLTDRLGLPQDTPQKLVDMRKTAEETVRKVRQDQSLSVDQRNETLQAIQNETRKSFTEQLGGDKNYKSWRRQSGYWMSNLAPPPPSKP